ncbi:MAG TPA: TRAP transporter small permease subunit, partial [Kofleriaceae bacterium]|nr:TRAP transporter small permease subunit [Kofleriaceae bacterium]
MSQDGDEPEDKIVAVPARADEVADEVKPERHEPHRPRPPRPLPRPRFSGTERLAFLTGTALVAGFATFFAAGYTSSFSDGLLRSLPAGFAGGFAATLAAAFGFVIVDAREPSVEFPDDGATESLTLGFGLFVFIFAIVVEWLLGLADREWEDGTYFLLVGIGVVFTLVGLGSTRIRKIDQTLGKLEQGALFAILAAVVLTAATHAIKEKLTGLGLWWSFDIIRVGTFSIAMLGAAFATQQSRHLAMDLISSRLAPRGRLVVAILLSAFTIAIAAILLRSGMHQAVQVVNEPGEHLIQ